ncbi:hypothetical protein [Thalassotalea sp. PLHSN55]|uniref:hypothetical protein n=1 Tax=Thalassotalea sp. PLHSN55 TaxID=3435888 RepID=UPI003F865A66
MGPHGHIDYTWQENVLIIKTSGPFNIEGVKQCAAEIVTTVEEKAFPSWYRVDILDHEALGSPDVMAIIGKSHLWSNALPTCKKAAICCANHIQLTMMKRFIAQENLATVCFTEQTHTDQFIEQCLNPTSSF